MAVLNFSITVPDAQVSRVQTAIKSYLGDPGMTNAAAVEGMRQQFIARVKEIVVAHEKTAAVVAAEAANYNVDAT
jgi:hypothetical protein